MQKHNIVYLHEANADLDEILDYISLDSFKYAEKTINEIFSEIRKLEEFPLMGSSLSKKIIEGIDFRKLIVGNYIVFYRIIGTEILIYRILHAKRDCSKILKLL